MFKKLEYALLVIDPVYHPHKPVYLARIVVFITVNPAIRHAGYDNIRENSRSRLLSRIPSITYDKS
jgi:hypothetical protein